MPHDTHRLETGNIGKLVCQLPHMPHDAAVTESEFLTVSELVRGRVKLAEVNQVTLAQICVYPILLSLISLTPHQSGDACSNMHILYLALSYLSLTPSTPHPPSCKSMGTMYFTLFPCLYLVLSSGLIFTRHLSAFSIRSRRIKRGWSKAKLP